MSTVGLLLHTETDGESERLVEKGGERGRKGGRRQGNSQRRKTDTKGPFVRHRHLEMFSYSFLIPPLHK